tara:strand:- start:190 stop:489 length:300 start_codon:yes stop_codon:yes gene_type:complete
MEFLKVLKRKKLLFLNIFFLLYISINLFTGERGLISYFEKKTLLSNLNNEKEMLFDELQSVENKNNLLSNIQSYDLVDTLIREKFMYGKKGEVLIKTND